LAPPLVFALSVVVFLDFDSGLFVSQGPSPSRDFKIDEEIGS